jgi:hypothetical protein
LDPYPAAVVAMLAAMLYAPLRKFMMLVGQGQRVNKNRKTVKRIRWTKDKRRPFLEFLEACKVQYHRGCRVM